MSDHGVDTRGGEERDATVLQIVRAKRSKTGFHDSGSPVERASILRVEHLTLRGREDVGLSGESVDVPCQLVDQRRWQAHRPSARRGLRRSFVQLARDFDHVVRDADCPSSNINVRAT